MKDLETIADYKRGCKHTFIVVSKKKSDKAEHATQLMCQYCCILAPFKDIAETDAQVRELWSRSAPTEESQTDDDS